MYEFLEDIAQTNAIRHVNSSLKLLVGLGCILISVFSQSPVVPILIATSISLIIIFAAKIQFSFYLKLLMVPLSFALVSVFVIVLFTGGGETLCVWSFFGYPLSVTTGSLDMGFLILVRIIGGMCSLFFISLTTPVTEIFTLMRKARLPVEFIDLSMLMYRYIFIFIEQAGQIYQSQVMRLGYGDFRESVNSFGMMSGALFLNTWESGENLMLAMDARCYNGRFALIEESLPISKLLLTLVVFYLVIMLFLVYITADFSLTWCIL